MNQENVGHQLGAFVAATREAEIPEAVLAKVRANLLHDLVCALAAQPMGEPLWRMSRDRLPAQATLISDGTVVEAEQAAFANGALMHTRAQDDTHFAAKTHVGSTVFPAALAAGQAEGVDGDTFLRAALAGCEVAAAVGERMARSSTARGFRASPVFGTLGAAAAASLVYGLDSERTSSAIAIASSFSGGLNQTWIDGTSEYRLQIGMAARNGIFAARLSDDGFNGAARWFEGDAGFAKAFADQLDDAEWQLGERWRTLDVTNKPFPVCAITQSLVQAAIDLATEFDVDPGRIEDIRLKLNPEDRTYPGTLNKGPFGDVAATLMSAEYCAAMALVQRSATLEGLRRFDDPEILRLVEMTEVVADESLPALGGGLEIRIDGETHARSLVPDESTYNWGWDQVLANARKMVGEVPGGQATIDELAARVQELETAESVGALMEATVR